MHSTNCLICCGTAFLPGKLGNAEIHDLNGAVCQEHNILRFDIPVHNSPVMRMLERAQNLNDKVHSILPVQNLLAVNVILQRDAVNIFHDDILHLFRKSHIVDFHNIGMGQHCNCLGFIPEPPLELLTLGILRLQDFNSYNTVVQNINSAVYIGHTALTDEFCQFIAAVQPGSDKFIFIHMHSSSIL